VLASAVNQRLKDLVRAPSRANADTLLELLENDALCGLVGPDGQGCDQVAAAALISLGYPYALEISPEVLERLRGERKGRRTWSLKQLGWWALVALLLLAALGIYLDAAPSLPEARVPLRPWPVRPVR
jgi:hypothetical protein